MKLQGKQGSTPQAFCAQDFKEYIYFVASLAMQASPLNGFPSVTGIKPAGKLQREQDRRHDHLEPLHLLSMELDHWHKLQCAEHARKHSFWRGPDKC